MPQLNQIIAVANGKKSHTQSVVTQIYHLLQKPQLFDGLTRTYRPKDDEGDRLPSEEKRLQCRVPDVVEEAVTAWSELFDIVATQEAANTRATANVKVNGTVIAHEVPVTVLLFLEKQLVDIHTFVSKWPTVDPSEDWEHSPEAACYASKPQETTRSKKVLRNHVKAEATKEHPAQVEVYTEDELVGYWRMTKFSGAVTEQEKREALARVRDLQEAVKMAREEANSATAEDYSISNDVFDFLFPKRSTG